MKIKEARKAAGLTQKQFAELFNPPIPIDTVKSWDCGRTSPPEWAQPLILERIEKRKER